MNLIPINQITEDFENHLHSNSFSKSPENLYDPLHYFLSLGGKRIRPILVLVSHQLFEKEYSKSFPAATAIEYFHNFSLIHDDIMDEAILRRGEETVHKKWNTPIAILSGDVLLVHAYRQLSFLPTNCQLDCLKLFNQTAIEVCEGQQMDMDFERRTFVNAEEYIQMIKLKTSVLLACALQMGAIIAGADLENQHKLYQLGIEVGLSFQIHDDYLDLYNNDPLFGKKRGGDLLQNKKTILSIKAVELIGEKEYLSFQERINKLNEEEKILSYLTFFDKIGVKKEIENLQENYNKSIFKTLNQIKTLHSKDNLNQLVSLILDRKH
ncbi:MAG: polyprenyl synthetase family protein [Flavobacteriia bacterium]|nr:polyprenyl synthetase family protein [Flavobacteriia bacterium]